MRNILSLLLAGVVLFGVYSVVFGLPDQVASMINCPAPTAVDATQGSPTRGTGRRPGGGGARSTTVVTSPVTLQPFETVLNAIGTATALHHADVVADAAGEVIAVNMAANTIVEAGAILVQLDPRAETLRLEIAQAQLDQAVETVARFERLRAGGNATVTDVSLSDARIAARLAQANLGLAQVALDDRTIRAPIAGKLGLSDIEVGDMLRANDPIVTIDDDAALLVTFELPERAIGILANVTTIQASTPTFTGRNFVGDIISFDSRLDSVTRSVTVKARIDNEDRELWPGMTFAVRMVDAGEPLPSIPTSALTWSRDGASIWVDVDGVAKQTPVTILYRRGTTAWIDADIETGTFVVSEGAQKLREGAAIRTPRSQTDAPAPRAPSGAETPRKPAQAEAPT